MFTLRKTRTNRYQATAAYDDGTWGRSDITSVGTITLAQLQEKQAQYDGDSSRGLSGPTQTVVPGRVTPAARGRARFLATRPTLLGVPAEQRYFLNGVDAANWVIGASR
jgi:hypothetical protein